MPAVFTALRRGATLERPELHPAFAVCPPGEVLRRHRAAPQPAARDRAGPGPRLDAGRRTRRIRHPARAAAAGADPADAAQRRHGAARAGHAGAARGAGPRGKRSARARLGRLGAGLRHGRAGGAVVQRLPRPQAAPGALRPGLPPPVRQPLDRRAPGTDGLCRRLCAAGHLDRLAGRAEPPAAGARRAGGDDAALPAEHRARRHRGARRRPHRPAGDRHAAGHGAAEAGEALRALQHPRRRPGHRRAGLTPSPTRWPPTAPTRASTAPSPSA